MSTVERLVARIKKLRALGTSSNPNEAAAALAEAQRLAYEHGVTEEQIAAGGDVVELKLTERLGRSQFEDWEAVLAQGVAQTNGCLVVCLVCCPTCMRTQELTLCGRQRYVDATLAVLDAARAALQRLGREAVGAGRLDDAGAIGSFMMGAAVTVVDRLKREKEAYAKDGGHAALVAVDDALEAALAHVRRRGDTHTRFVGAGDQASYEAGKAAGLSVTVGGPPGAPRLLGSG